MMNFLPRKALECAILLSAVGALNWGAIGLLDWDAVAALFGGDTSHSASPATRGVYALVGLSGLIAMLASGEALITGISLAVVRRR